MRIASLPIALALLLVPEFACTPDSGGASLSFGRHSAPIYYGTREPQVFPLTAGQQLAIGWLHWYGSPSSNFCSGTLVSPNVVATAAHCFEGGTTANNTGFSVGLMPNDPDASFDVAEVVIHPQVDAALLVLSSDATARLPSLQPITVRTTSPQEFVGEWVDVAGYGQTDDGSEGRYFARVSLETVASTTVQVYGHGEQGLCYGDSGGPLLGDNATIMAVESNGDDSCTGWDTMTRLDTIADWIAEAGGSEPPVDECGDLDYLGRCNGDVAEWCQDGQIATHDCAAEGLVCGWVDDETGYYCMQGSTTPGECGDLDYLGRCNGDVAEWCQDGQIAQHDCGAEGLDCGWVDDQTGYYCTEGGTTPDECGDLTERGRCSGTVLERCVDGAVETTDCGARGQQCQYVSAAAGYGCVDATAPDACNGVSERGRCTGDVLERCVSNQLQTIDCGDDGLECRYVNATVGYDCIAGPAPSDPCASVPSAGRCDGDTAVWCEGDTLFEDDCAATGKTCGFLAVDGRFGCLTVAPANCTTAENACDGGVAVRCVAGTLVREDCAAVGQRCQFNALLGQPVCAPSEPGTPDAGSSGGSDAGSGGQGDTDSPVDDSDVAGPKPGTDGGLSGGETGGGVPIDPVDTVGGADAAVPGGGAGAQAATGGGCQVPGAAGAGAALPLSLLPLLGLVIRRRHAAR